MKSRMSTARRQKTSPWRQVLPSALLGPKTQTSHQRQYVWVLGRTGNSMTACRKSPKCDWPRKRSWQKQPRENNKWIFMSSWYCYHGPFQHMLLTRNEYHVEVTIMMKFNLNPPDCYKFLQIQLRFSCDFVKTCPDQFVTFETFYGFRIMELRQLSNVYLVVDVSGNWKVS